MDREEGNGVETSSRGGLKEIFVSPLIFRSLRGAGVIITTSYSCMAHSALDKESVRSTWQVKQY